MFASKKGSLFHSLFSRETKRKNIATKLLVAICFLPVSHEYKESNSCSFLCANRQKNDNVFSLCLPAKQSTCFPCVFQENTDFTCFPTLFSQKTVTIPSSVVKYQHLCAFNNAYIRGKPRDPDYPSESITITITYWLQFK